MYNVKKDKCTGLLFNSAHLSYFNILHLYIINYIFEQIANWTGKVLRAIDFHTSIMEPFFTIFTFCPFNTFPCWLTAQWKLAVNIIGVNFPLRLE